MEPKLLTAERFVDMTTEISYRYVYSDTEYFRPHFHDYYELFLLLDGKVTHLVNGEEIPISKGTLVFIRPNDIHDYILRDGVKFSMLNMTFTAATVDALMEYLGEGFPSLTLLRSALPPQVTLNENEFEYVLSHMTTIRTIEKEDYGRLKTALRILIFRIFTRFFADFREESDEKIPLWLTELCETMQKDGNFTYGLSRMLELTDKTREHLARSLKKYMGITPSEFINNLRLRMIASMLKNSNHDIADIIFESGFGNISWASELFKKKGSIINVGVKPTDIANKL